jgi:hypothetical protein
MIMSDNEHKTSTDSEFEEGFLVSREKVNPIPYLPLHFASRFQEFSYIKDVRGPQPRVNLSLC